VDRASNRLEEVAVEYWDQWVGNARNQARMWLVKKLREGARSACRLGVEEAEPWD